MLEDDDMERLYDESGGRLMSGDPFLLARKLSSSGRFGAKFSENSSCTASSLERLESSCSSTTEVSRTASSGSLTEDVSEDVYTLLASKERDLILAAELGKALLEKNEELSKQNEKIAEEFSQKLEVLEQEKYQLRRQLEVAEEEYQLRLSELQSDVISLRETLERQEIMLRLQERERSQLISDLTEQNQRLTQELREVAETERELRNQIQRMRSQFSQRRTSMQEHFYHVESLRDEIDTVLSRKAELEKQIQGLLDERESLTTSLDMSVGKIQELERKQREHEGIIRLGERELDELRSSNHHLLERLETLSRSRSSSPSLRMSLQSEMEMSGSESDKSLRRPCDVIDELDEEFEIEETGSELTCQGREELRELAEEVVTAYSQLRNMCRLLRDREKKSRKRSGDSMETSTTASSSESLSSVRAGQLTEVVSEIRGLMHDFLRQESRCWSSGSCPSCGRSKEEKLQLEAQLHQTLEQMERGQISLRQAESLAKNQESELQGIRSKLALLETRLAAAEEERQVLKRDLEQASSTRDDTIRRAWETRDSAVKRKNSAEVELARARIDFMQFGVVFSSKLFIREKCSSSSAVNSQLLEAVQQKVAISQQLEDWETDLHLVIGQRLENSQSDVANKNGGDKPSEKHAPLTRKPSRPNSRIMSFFQR